MFLKLLALFVTVPVIEMIVLIEVGKRLGTLPTIALVMLTGAVGISLARAQGFSVLSRLRQQMEMGILPEEELIAGLVILAGALLLLTPGLITDVFGFACLLPWPRSLLVLWIRKFAARHISMNRFEQRYP